MRSELAPQSEPPSTDLQSGAPAVAMKEPTPHDLKREAILHGPVLPTLLRLGLPVIAVIVAQTAVAVTETYWISRLGTDALVGVTLVLPVFVLMATMSNGGIGGGVSSAVARTVGAGRTEEADALLLHAIVLAVGFGLLFTAGAVLGGRALYEALGGKGAALDAALLYSGWVFGAAVPIWIVNLIASALRGAGEVRLPAIVTLAGAAALFPLSPALIFGWGPLPRLEIAGAGLAVVLYYIVSLMVFLRYLTRGGAALNLRWSRLRRSLFWAILGVGLLSALGTLMASLTVVAVTGAVGLAGPSALAGFGIASRLDSLLVPILFGLGTAVITMVGVATGAGLPERANRVSWTAAGLAFAVTEVIGVAAALFPHAWVGLFSDDPDVLAAGATYLRVVAPFYGAIGLGLILYFACQGRGKVFWPFVAGGVRLAVTAGGAWWLASQGASLAVVFVAASTGSVLFGAINAFGLNRLARAGAPSKL